MMSVWDTDLRSELHLDCNGGYLDNRSDNESNKVSGSESDIEMLLEDCKQVQKEEQEVNLELKALIAKDAPMDRRAG